MAGSELGLTLIVTVMIILLYAVHEFYEKWIPREARRKVALQLITMGLAIFGDAYAVATGVTLSSTLLAVSLLVMVGELAVHRSLGAVVALARMVTPPAYPVLTISLLASALTEGSIEWIKRRKHSG